MGTEIKRKEEYSCLVEGLKIVVDHKYLNKIIIYYIKSSNYKKGQLAS